VEKRITILLFVCYKGTKVEREKRENVPELPKLKPEVEGLEPNKELPELKTLRFMSRKTKIETK
jgi:hypothetical protein